MNLVACTSNEDSPISQVNKYKPASINKFSKEQYVNNYHIPTRKRTERRSNNTGQPRELDLLGSKSDMEVTQMPKQKRKRKLLEDDKAENKERKPIGHYSLDQKATRLANNKRFRKNNEFGTFDEAFKAARERLTEMKRDENKRGRLLSLSLGRKKKDYHSKDYRTKEGIIKRKTVQLLKERNGIFNHDNAREKAEQWYQERNENKKKRRYELYAQRNKKRRS